MGQLSDAMNQALKDIREKVEADITEMFIGATTTTDHEPPKLTVAMLEDVIDELQKDLPLVQYAASDYYPKDADHPGRYIDPLLIDYGKLDLNDQWRKLRRARGEADLVIYCHPSQVRELKRRLRWHARLEPFPVVGEGEGETE